MSSRRRSVLLVSHARGTTLSFHKVSQSSRRLYSQNCKGDGAKSQARTTGTGKVTGSHKETGRQVVGNR